MTRTPILIFFLAIVSASCAQLQSACTTPDHREGVCRPLNNCSMLYSCIQRLATSNETAEFLRKSQCGFGNDNQPLVCCETKYMPSTTHKTENPCYPEILPRMSNRLPAQCGALRHVRARRTQPIAYPWMVLLDYDSPWGKTSPCAGALISDRYVLAAAHCVTEYPHSWNLKHVRHTRNPHCSNQVRQTKGCVPTVTYYPIEDTIIHEEYYQQSEHRYNDIALLKLATPVIFHDTAAPICLPGVVYEPQELTLAVWSLSGEKDASDAQMKVAFPSSSRDTASTHGRNDSVSSPHMCTVSNLWRRDSGGPLMAEATNMLGKKRWTIFGLVSYGPSRGDIKRPGTYTRISPYVEWILNKMN